ncbi:MFS transporter [Paenibacillus sp. NRS-1782]|uniref:MFS transporter n=1 Tax=unclassified Paenibacillus TaxID=185978 RepID=UPI003D2C7EED
MGTYAEMSKQPQENKSSLFKNVSFLFVLLSITFNSSGISIYLLAESWYVVNHLTSGNSLGIVLMATAIPRLVLMPFTGILADRYKKTYIMFLSDIFRGLLLIVMVFCFLSNILSFSAVVTFAILFGILEAFYWPASSSLIPVIVSENHLAQANSLSQIIQQFFSLAGPLIGGVILTYGSYHHLFGSISAILILGAFSSLFVSKYMHKAQHSSSESLHLVKEWKEGIHFIKEDAFIKAIIIVLIVAGFFLTGPLSMAIPLIVNSVLHGSALTLSYLEMSVTVGMIAGGVLIVVSKIQKRRALISLLSLALCGLAILFLGISVNFLQTLLLLGIIGFVISFSNTFFVTLLQERTPQDKIGRVLSLVTTATTGLVPLSQALISIFLNKGLQISQILVSFGVIVCVFCIMMMLMFRPIRNA